MMSETQEGCFHALLRDGLVVSVGEDQARKQKYTDVVEWFDTRAERETDPRVIAYRDRREEVKQLSKVEGMKSDTEYRQKAIEAQDIADNDNYDATKHKFIALEVAHAGKTPMQAAQDVLTAIETAALKKAEKRIKLRQKLRT